MAFDSRKTAALTFVTLLIASTLAAFAPTAVSHTEAPEGGTFVLDVDFTPLNIDVDDTNTEAWGLRDDYWRTRPLEWGLMRSNLQIRHIPGSFVNAEPGPGTAQVPRAGTGATLVLCSPTQDNTASTGIASATGSRIEIESNSRDFQHIKVFDPTGANIANADQLEDPLRVNLGIDEPPFSSVPSLNFAPLYAGLDPVNPDVQTVQGATIVDLNGDGRVTRTELTAVANAAATASVWPAPADPAPAPVYPLHTDVNQFPGFRATFERIDVTEMGTYSVRQTNCNGTVLTQFIVEGHTRLQVAMNPSTVTFRYDDRADEPEPLREDLAATVTWGGHGMRDAQVTFWACNRERPATAFCDDTTGWNVGAGTRSAAADPTADPLPEVLDRLSGRDGLAERRNILPGAGTYLVEATCILIDDRGRYVFNPRDLDRADERHECYDPNRAVSTTLIPAGSPAWLAGAECADMADPNVPAGETIPRQCHQLRGNTTITILPGDLTVTQVKGDRPIANRLSEVVWRVNYPNSQALTLADNTHGDDNDRFAVDYANADANLTLSIRLPNGRFVLLNYDLGVAEADNPADARAGILSCAETSTGPAGCGLTTWDLVEPEAVTTCDLFEGDNRRCPEATGGSEWYDINTGNVGVIALPIREADINTGLDPRVFEPVGLTPHTTGSGIRMRLNPALDAQGPDEEGFYTFDTPRDARDERERRLGYLSAYIPWSAGTYRFELRANHYGDHMPEFVGAWTLNVESPPAFGFADVRPLELDVPGRPNDLAFGPDPITRQTPEELDERAEDVEDDVFSYILAFTLRDADNNNVNAWPCEGTSRDGRTLRENDEIRSAGDETLAQVDWIDLHEDVTCARFSGVDDLRIEGNLLYEIRDEWIIETHLAGATSPHERCSDVGGDLHGRRGLADPVAVGPLTTLNAQLAALAPDTSEVLRGVEPVYCVFNVVPMSPTPVRVVATINNQEYVQEWNVSSGGFVRVTQVTAAPEGDGTVRLSVTDRNGQPLSGDLALFRLGDAPEDSSERVVSARDTDRALRASGTGGQFTFTFSEDDEVEAGRYGVFFMWDARDDTFDYAYATFNLEPRSDLETSVEPTRVTAGVPTEFTVEVNAEDDFEAYFLTQYEYLRVQRLGVLYVDDSDFRQNQVGFDIDQTDFLFGGNVSDPTEVTLKAEGPYRVYVRNADRTRDNNGTMPTVEVVPPMVTFTPGQIAFAIMEDVEVIATVTDADGRPLNGTLRVAFDPDHPYFDSDDYGFAWISGGDTTTSWTSPNTDWDQGTEDDYSWTYLEYRENAGPGDSDDVDNVGTLPAVGIRDGRGRLRVEAREIGPINWTFRHVDGDLWVNVTGMLDLVAPQITLTPNRLLAGQGTDVQIMARDLEGAPVQNLYMTLCGTPVATGTTCTGVVATDANGSAAVSVFPAGTGQIEVYIHADIADPIGDCVIRAEDFNRINPLTGLPLAGQLARLDGDCFTPINPATEGAITDSDYRFRGTNVFLPVVAQQQLLTVQVADTVQVNQSANIAVLAAGAPQSGATVTVTGPGGQQAGTGQTNAAGVFAFTPQAEGTYTVRATSAGFSDGTATFRAVTSVVDPSATFTVTDFAVSPTTVTVGDTVEGRATITNTGTQRGSANVLLLVNGAQRASQSVTLGPGESQSVAFDFTPSVAGTARMQMRAGDATSDERTVTVNPRSTTPDDGTPDEPTPPVTPGFEALFALAALGVAFLAFRRRK